MPDKQFYVEVVDYDKDEEGEDPVVKRMGPFSERKADRVNAGISINLNHENFYTRIVEEA